jgi:hypothetical protein
MPRRRKKNPGTDLDVASPEKVLDVLTNAAWKFYDSADELNIAHQDASAGRPWTIIADELIKASDRILSRLVKAGYKV